MTPAELQQAVAFEREWDPRMGGPSTRADREYLGYSTARLLESGASIENIAAYLRALVAFDDHAGIRS